MPLQLSEAGRGTPVVEPAAREMQRRDSESLDEDTKNVTQARQEALQCHHCTLPFSTVRLERACLECETLNCHFCCALYRLNTLGEREPRALCVECLPVVQRKLAALANGGGPDAAKAKSEMSQVFNVLLCVRARVCACEC